MTGWRVRVALLLLTLLVLLGAGALVYETWWDDFSSRTHYDALGVATTASLRDIKRAFRDRSLQYHPDKATGSSTALSTRRFHRISDAYQVLSDASARAAYDHELAERARFDVAQQQHWQLQLTPTMRDWPSALQFYVTEFPLTLLTLALRIVDARLLAMALVCLGCVVFAVDLAVRITRVLYTAVRTTSSSSHLSSTARQANDAAMRAARVRQQQQALDARRAHAAALTQRRVQQQVQQSRVLA